MGYGEVRDMDEYGYMVGEWKGGKGYRCVHEG